MIEQIKSEATPSVYSFSTPEIIGAMLNVNPNFSSVEGDSDDTFKDVGIDITQNASEHDLVMFMTISNLKDDSDVNKHFGGVNVKYDFKFTINAKFTWDDKRTPDEVQKFGQYSAATLLISYARAYLHQLTSMSRYGAVDLPFVDASRMPYNPEPVNK